jgi:branched-chain amino acid aminotransferase
MMTDHLLEIDWTAEGGWEKPIISKYRQFEIDPACSALHYAIQCFEGIVNVIYL